MKCFVTQLLCLTTVLLFSPAYAQRTVNEIISTAMSAKDKQLPSLGMYVLSIEDGKKVLMSKTGRYIVKGTVTDMWDGLVEKGQQASNFPSFPSLLNVEDFTLHFGDSSKSEVLAYVSFGCNQCAEVVRQILSPEFIANHSVRIMLVSNSDEDKLVASNVYCAVDKHAVFKELFLERKYNSVKKDCIHPQIDMNIGLANAQRIKALPSTFFKDKKLVYLGTLPNNI